MSCFIRKTSIEPDEEEQKMIKKIGFYDWISESQSIDRLREYVVHNLANMNHEKEQARLIFNKEGEVKQEELRAILHVLSKKKQPFSRSCLIQMMKQFPEQRCHEQSGETVLIVHN